MKKLFLIKIKIKVMIIKIIRAIKARIIFVDILCIIVVQHLVNGAPRRTRTLHNGSEEIKTICCELDFLYHILP